MSRPGISTRGLLTDVADGPGSAPPETMGTPRARRSTAPTSYGSGTPVLGHSCEVPMLFQNGATDCGIACFAMIAQYHGLQIASVPEAYIGVRLTATQIVKLAHSSDIGAAAFEVSVPELSTIGQPAILHWHVGHFVVLADVRAECYRIHDPALGVRELDQSALATLYSGTAIAFHSGLIGSR